MQLFEMKTGRFTPLPASVLAKFSDEQRRSYDELASVVADLDAANLETASAVAANRATVAALHEAEVREAKRPKWTLLDEIRRSQAQWRIDHQ